MRISLLVVIRYKNETKCGKGKALTLRLKFVKFLVGQAIVA
ncbi:MAG: hypothetical protein ACUVTN_00945 [Thermodesulfobacteriota bacterium]